MPIYCYRVGREVYEREYPMGHAPKEIYIRGKKAKRDYRAEAASVPATTGWPLKCVASGVHPSQAQELRDFYKKNGVPTDVAKDGDPIYRDAKHRKKALQVRGLYDKSSY